VSTGRGRAGPRAAARVIHEWRVYRARKECFVLSRIENATRGKDVLLVARGRARFDLTPGGRYTPEDYWTAVAKPWKTWTQGMTGGRKTRRASDGMVQGLRLAEEWFDAYTDGPVNKPRVNVGLVFQPAGHKVRLRAGEQGKRFQVTVDLDANWPRVAPKGRLAVGFWIVPHEGGPDEVRDFWRATRNIDVVPGTIQTRPK